MQNKRDVPEERPVGTGQTETEVLDHLYRLPFNQQLRALVALAPRILSRLDDDDRRRRLRALRGAPLAQAKLSRPGTSGGPPAPVEVVIGEVLKQSFAEQLRIFGLAAPRIAADLEGQQRKSFLDELEGEVDKALRGDAGLEEQPIT